MDPATAAALALTVTLGACIGSFANVVAYRMPRSESIVTPPSHCPKCGRRLTPAELAPIVSWLALKGRCRGCRQRISARYPLVEALFAAAFLGLALLTRPDPSAAAEVARYALQAASLSMLLIAALIDLDTKQLPDTLVYGAIAAGLAATLLPTNPNAAPHLTRPAGETLTIALAAAGAFTLLERYATHALRRARHTIDPPLITSHHILTAATLATILGPWRALAATTALIVIDARTRTPLRAPQPLHLLLIPTLTVAAHLIGKPAPVAATDALTAAGAAALAAGLAWWAADHLTQRRENETPDGAALGFGDVKLAAALAALLPEPLLLSVALMAASVTGVLHGAAAQQRAVPFGPHLLLGTVTAAAIGPQLIRWYAATTGIPL